MPGKDRLPRRDYIILPLLSLATIVLMFAGAEMVARFVWVEQQHDACEIDDGGAFWDIRFKPNCTSQVKFAESAWITNHYNECGYRSDDPCAPKAPNALRVAIMGTSVSWGYYIPYRDSFGATVTAELTRQCGRPVDVQNLAVARTRKASGPIWHNLYRNTNEALALNPDVIVMTFSPYDLEQYTQPPSETTIDSTSPSPERSEPSRLGSAMQRVRDVLHESRAATAALHFAYLKLSVYLPLYLKHGDEADYLRPPFTHQWQMRLGLLDTLLAHITERTKTAMVPFVLVFVPSRAAAALSAQQGKFAGIDPTALGAAVGEIAKRSGVEYIDMTKMMGSSDALALEYFPADGHPSGPAHVVIGQAVVQRLLNKVSPFTTCQSIPAITANQGTK